MTQKQRGNHEGSVCAQGARSGKPTGRWVAQVWINGQKRRAIATSEAKAKQKLRTMMSDLDSGRIAPRHESSCATRLHIARNVALQPAVWGSVDVASRARRPADRLDARQA